MSPRLAGAALAFATTTAAVLSLPPASLGQAWLPPRGEASLSLGLQRITANDHVFSRGERLDRGRMRWHHVLPDLSYGVTDRFAVRLTLPYVISRYDGAFPHPGLGANRDDGNWHGTFQDFRFEAKYMATTGSVVLTPFLAVVLPATSYETFSHAAPGRHLREVMAGVYAGRRLDPVLPEAYAHARYSLALPERVLDISNNRSNASLEFGYFVTPAITVRALGQFQKSHGGWRIPEDAGPPGGPLSPFHDQLARDDSVVIGAGASMAATGSIDVSVTAFRYVAGRNTTATSGISLGVGWGFSPAQIIRKRRGPPPDGTDPS